MKESCLSQNPLVRGGISQEQRLLKALLPTYIGVDERSMKDLVLLVKGLAGEIQYYEYDEVAKKVMTDSWEAFFNIAPDDWEGFSLEDFLDNLKIDQQTEPHLALFFAFLYIFRMAQDDMNTITKRHLDFYYREVLQLQEKPAISDQVAVIFSLARNVDEHLIKKGTQLKGGKDAKGVERIYEVEKDIVVNKAQVAELKSVFANINDSFSALTPYPENNHRIYISPVTNSADGQGAAIENEEKSWETFGRPGFPLHGTGLPGENEADRKQAEIGFALASPVLFLAEGTRKVTLTIQLQSNIFSGKTTLFSERFKVLFSGEKEWIAPVPDLEDITMIQSDRLVITRTLTADQAAVIAYNEGQLQEPFKTQWPIVKIILNTENDANPFLYKTFKNLKPQNVKIKVNVTGVRNLVLQNDQSVLDAGKPFLPFGNRPYVGSNFYVGSWEVLQKKLKSLQLSFKWNDLPSDSNGFKDYYKNYTDSSTGSARSNDKFQVAVSSLDKKEWKPLATSENLFTDNNGNPLGENDPLPSPEDENSKIIVHNPSASGLIDRDETLEVSESYDVNTVKGYLRITLKGIDFGHATFPNSYAKQAIALAGYEPGSNAYDAVNSFSDGVNRARVTDRIISREDPNPDIPTGPPELPNEPYTPSMQDFALSYISEVDFNTENTDTEDFENRIEQFFHLQPFGANEIDTTGATFLLPQFRDEGNLYIGIGDLKPGQTLSILFQVAEGSANPDKARQEVLWYYLADNQWVPFETNGILSDTTNGLLTSGITSFAIPADASKENTLLPAGLHWLMAAVEENADAICRLIDVRTQAVIAKFRDHDNDPDHLRLPLAAESIGKLLIADGAVDKVLQPYASFGGAVKEESSDYYTRVSERLRHKQRAVTIWDYEHLILEAFPSVYKVKCINHTRFEGTFTNYSEMQPGHVTLIVVSNVQNKNAVDPLRPKTSLSTLDEIHACIDAINPGCVELHVRNPIYEEVKTKFKVKFSVADTGFYQAKLENEIKAFLSPWSSDCFADIRFGGSIHKSVILNFVEERSYVDYVTCFEMFHIVPEDPDNNPDKDVDEAVATTAVSILGSSGHHEIEPVPFESYSCACRDNLIRNTTQLASADDCQCQDKDTFEERAVQSMNNDINLI